MSSRLVEDIAASFAESIGHVLVSALRFDLLFAYIIVEAVFFVFVWVLWKRTSHQTAPVHRDQAADWSKIYPIFLADAESRNVKASDLFLAWLREWMSLESDSDVHIDDARVFLSWAFDRTPPSDRKPGALTSRIISDIQAVGAELKEGSDGKARHDYYNLRSRVPCSHWLLVAYMSMYLLELVVFAFLHLMGFRRHRHGRLRYWARGLDSSEPMNVFLHGMGMGFTLYLGLIRAMGKAPLLMIELPWVSLDIRNFFQQIRPTREVFLMIIGASCRNTTLLPLYTSLTPTETVCSHTSSRTPSEDQLFRDVFSLTQFNSTAFDPRRITSSTVGSAQ